MAELCYRWISSQLCYSWFSCAMLGSAGAWVTIMNTFYCNTLSDFRITTTKPLVEFMYLVFTHMPGESYWRRLRSFSLRWCDIFRALINSLLFLVTLLLIFANLGLSGHLLLQVTRQNNSDKNSFRSFLNCPERNTVVILHHCRHSSTTRSWLSVIKSGVYLLGQWFSFPVHQALKDYGPLKHKDPPICIPKEF